MIINHEVFYVSGASPRISTKEISALWKLGFAIQSEHPHPPELHMAYAMRGQHSEQNLKLLKELEQML